MLHRLGRSGLSGFARLTSDRRGVAAVLFAMMLPPLAVATGAAVDFARVGMLKTSLQTVTDGAALAGASALCLTNGDAQQAATDYFNKGIVPLGASARISTPSISEPSSTEVTVSATATVGNSLMRLVGVSETVSVTSSAVGPAYQLNVTKTGGFSASAADSNTIYFYNASTQTPPVATNLMTRLFTNDPNVDPNWQSDNANPKTISVGLNDVVGFALINITGGVYNYGSNYYGASQGSTHAFYSTYTVPSQGAYSNQGRYYSGTGTSNKENGNYWYRFGIGNWPGCSATTITSTNNSPTANDGWDQQYNLATGVGAQAPGTQSPTAYSWGEPRWVCGAHPCTGVSGNTVLQNNLLVNNSCSTASTVNFTCAQLQQSPASFAWNDMGGGWDDYDYNDAVYTVSCQPSTGGVQPNSVALIH